MIQTHGDARAWLAWAIAAGLIASATRNPVTLLVLLLVIGTVGVRTVPSGVLRGRCQFLVRALAWLTAASVVFNLLIVRAGTTPLLHLPADWPVIGGTLTVNALVYGLLTALGLAILLTIWTIFNSVVGQGDLLRLIPGPLYLAGVVTSIALTFAPGLSRAARDIREAQAIRGSMSHGARDWLPLAAPLLTTGLERGLSLAEAMEARGFGATPRATPATWPLMVGSLLAGLGLIVLVATPWLLVGSIGLSAGSVLLLHALKRAEAGRSRYRRCRWEHSDTIIALGALLAVTFLLLGRLAGDSALDYRVYPHVAPPQVSFWALAAVLALLGPVIAAERGWQ